MEIIPSEFVHDKKAFSWQRVTRKLVCRDPDFLKSFTGFLKGSMVLDSPISNERRGVILYEYCLERHPDMVDEISISWIEAGLSLKKAPAGNIVKIKHPETYLNGSVSQMTVMYASSQTPRLCGRKEPRA